MSPQSVTQAQVIESLPAHLRPFVAHQNYDSYTSRDHAAWRFLLYQLRENLSSSAHPTYLDGLARTGISLEAIPRIEDINACLSELDWRAVVVDGFLPPAIFMEFQAHKVLVIAVNMRSFAHMLYTPAPDIVHESAGHAPFLIDIDYAEFLQRFGELGMQAISNQADMDVYEAVRNLSIVKESTDVSAAQIDAAQTTLDQAVAASTEPSEAALLARLHWWTVEYGLVGEIKDYSIFGAGLLSSLGESVFCLDDQKVEKRQLTVDAIDVSYDITAQQPQLYVTESCRHLSQVLEEFGRKMACHQGGTFGLEVALNAATVCTIETNSGLQIAGKVSNLVKDAVGNCIYVNTQGPTQLAYANQELEGQGKAHHAHGFGSPLGRLIGLERCLSSYTVDELKRHGIEIDKTVTLNYLSGVQVQGTLTAIVRRDQKNILLTFDNCSVKHVDGTVLFDPTWGVFDMAVGDAAISVRGGSADPSKYPLYAAPSNKVTQTQEYDSATQAQFELYRTVRDLRENGAPAEQLEQFATGVSNNTKLDWLLIYEVIELLERSDAQPDIANNLRARLNAMLPDASGDEQTLIGYALARSHAA